MLKPSCPRKHAPCTIREGTTIRSAATITREWPLRLEKRPHSNTDPAQPTINKTIKNKKKQGQFKRPLEQCRNAPTFAL